MVGQLEVVHSKHTSEVEYKEKYWRASEGSVENKKCVVIDLITVIVAILKFKHYIAE